MTEEKLKISEKSGKGVVTQKPLKYNFVGKSTNNYGDGRDSKFLPGVVFEWSYSKGAIS